MYDFPTAMTYPSIPLFLGLYCDMQIKNTIGVEQQLLNKSQIFSLSPFNGRSLLAKYELEINSFKLEYSSNNELITIPTYKIYKRNCGTSCWEYDDFYQSKTIDRILVIQME